MWSIATIVIGRNEGERLRRCLTSVMRLCKVVIYVDSGSSDGSVAYGRSVGAEVVDLDTSAPFTAARARNRGFDYLLTMMPEPDYLFFIDGDCEVACGWMDQAVAELERRPDVAIVCGRLRERFPAASVYNRLCQIEWDNPIGEVESCGGIFIIRARAFKEVGKFDATIAAGEEPELCLRLRTKGLKIVRLPIEMASHDAAMLSFRQWWRRSVRSAYGEIDVAFRTGGSLFGRQSLSARVWAIYWPLAVLFAVMIGCWGGDFRAGVLAAGVVAAAFPIQIARVAWCIRRRAADSRTAMLYGVLTMIQKWAQICGQWLYWRDRRSGHKRDSIDYKILANVRPHA